MANPLSWSSPSVPAAAPISSLARWLRGLTGVWGVPVVVKNCPGAGATAAPALVAAGPPDGRTLLINTSAHAYSAALLDELPYDPIDDFVAIAPVTSQSYVLVAAASSGCARSPTWSARDNGDPGS